MEDIGSLDPDTFQPLNPGASDPAARLADLDAMGVAQQVVFPTLFGEYLPQVLDEAAAVSPGAGLQRLGLGLRRRKERVGSTRCRPAPSAP